MFFDYLDKLRAKPIHVRKRIAFFTTATLSLLIGSICWNSWNATPEDELAAKAPSPWSAAFDIIGSAKDQTLQAWKETKDGLTDMSLQYAATAEALPGEPLSATPEVPEPIAEPDAEHSDAAPTDDEIIAPPEEPKSQAIQRTRPRVMEPIFAQGGATTTEGQE